MPYDPETRGNRVIEKHVRYTHALQIVVPAEMSYMERLSDKLFHTRPSEAVVTDEDLAILFMCLDNYEIAKSTFGKTIATDAYFAATLRMLLVKSQERAESRERDT